MGIFCGDSKPSSLTEYLEPFVNELNALFINGFVYGAKTYNCKLDGPFIFDTPAIDHLLKILRVTPGTIRVTNVR